MKVEISLIRIQFEVLWSSIQFVSWSDFKLDSVLFVFAPLDLFSCFRFIHSFCFTFILVCLVSLLAAWCTTSDAIIFISIRRGNDRIHAYIRFHKVHINRCKTIETTLVHTIRTKESPTGPIVRNIEQLCEKWRATVQNILIVWSFGFCCIAALFKQYSWIVEGIRERFQYERARNQNPVGNLGISYHRSRLHPCAANCYRGKLKSINKGTHTHTRMQTRNKITHTSHSFIGLLLRKGAIPTVEKAKIVVTSNTNKILKSRIHTRNQINTLEIHSKPCFAYTGCVKMRIQKIELIYLYTERISHAHKSKYTENQCQSYSVSVSSLALYTANWFDNLFEFRLLILILFQIELVKLCINIDCMPHSKRGIIPRQSHTTKRRQKVCVCVCVFWKSSKDK